ncbi:hypothetical protein [Ectobacillus polymachus]|uniref:hypothetical protein n=1 Tax=Ectobacillus polymachus TaxID=1508806 RepID=UPI003A8430F3
MKTLYQESTLKMSEAIHHYFSLVEETNNFENISIENLNDDISKLIIAGGKGIEFDGMSSEELLKELNRFKAINFDIEAGVSAFVYNQSRAYIQELYRLAEELSNNFSELSPEKVKNSPYLLPIWQSVLNISSKANLKKIFGTATDMNISKPSSEKISEYANDYFGKHKVEKQRVIERTERTLEGIVRDLIGRLLFEAIVEKALLKYQVPFTKEEDYIGIKGVVYDFRADFVIPNSEQPLAFIEVRKSSSRHASLYAKDKMFSAINWKGKNQKMLGIVVAEGEWTKESLKAMSKVFDFVVPVASAEMLAQEIKKYLDGDNTVLKWIIDFNIRSNE